MLNESQSINVIQNVYTQKEHLAKLYDACNNTTLPIKQ